MIKNILLLGSLLTTLSAMADNQPHDWENQHVLQINREPACAYFMPENHLSLNGMWKFRWTQTPQEQTGEFYLPSYDDSKWDNFQVPGDWEMNGYGTPIYSSSGYTFKINPPYVMGEPKKTYTAYVERNPTGCYRRTFSIPDSWNGQEIYLRFGAVSSAFYVWVNGQKVGYSQGSMEPSTFRITPYLQAGTNSLALQVFKYSDGSYLEDQDMWRIAGIHRDVMVYALPKINISDFGVRTILNDRFDEAQMVIDPKLTVVGVQRGEGYQVEAMLYDAQGQQLLDSVLKADAVPMLNLDHKAAIMNDRNPQRGYPKWGWMTAQVKNPKLWSAEHPYLYQLSLMLRDPDGKIIQTIRTKVGFRQLAIKDGVFMVNGIPTRLRGVNRHEMDPYTGHVISEERMLQDILLMKQANVNAVRTCHYPNTERWYELCDSLGIYVMDEVDLEEHGLRGQLASDPSWAAAWMDRTQRAVIRDRNHPCVIFWSLGNEAGWGTNFAMTAAWIHEYDPTRFVHYEGAQGPNHNDPAYVDVISRFYPRTQDEYLNPGVKDNNMERPENARWERLLSIARETTDSRPVLTSEYAHVMGNALGNFKEYWDEIYSHPRMLGGFIWEWADEGIIITDKLHKRFPFLPVGMTVYGGDFKDAPNLKAFCIKGVVSSTRETTPKYEEVKAVYAPIYFVYENGQVKALPRDGHTQMDNYTIETKQEYGLITVTARLKNKTPWAEAGHIVATQQFVTNDNWYQEVLGKLKTKKQKRTTVDETLLRQFFSMVRPHFFRAPTDNDKGFGNWIAKDWKNQGLDNLRDSVVTPLTISRQSDGSLKGHCVVDYKALNGWIRTDYQVTLLPDGTVDFNASYTPEGQLPPLPCMGNTFVMPNDYQQLEYYGRGPWDNYPDRKVSSPIAKYVSKVSEQYFHYPRPQYSGNHEQTAYVELKNGKRQGWRIQCVDKPFSFTAVPYSTEQLYGAAHDMELKEEANVYLSLDCAVLGLGNSSCGPGVLAKYAIPQKPHSLHVRFIPIK